MGTKKGMVRKTARKAYTKKARSGSVASMAKKAASFGKKKSGKYLMQDAKKGTKVPKGMHRMPNGKLMKNSDMKKAGHGMMKKAGSGYGGMKKAKSGLKKAPAGSKGNGMRALPKAVRNKIGFAKKGTKKGMVRKTARKAYMKKGGSTRKCKSGCK
tara:strand:- start:1265 stop:1732 length:468 start_codon:yes stop_codon:yes gene_type:complete